MSAPVQAQPDSTEPGPGLFAVRPLDDLDRVLTVDPASKAAICEPDSDEPDQLIRMRPVRRVYNVLNLRTDQYLGYYSDGRTGWDDQLAEWQVVSVDGFGEGVYTIRVVALDGPSARVLTYLGSGMTGLRPAAAPGDPAYTAQLWKFERETGNRPYSGELDSPTGS
ncbi:hypothetical protein [Nocardia bovistercoris]|uniref:RICIN domain-containing protein n=1 Tax=Nocardia bovistercoris TaxID=2785916 RepID=A0A931N6K6_9NOCA|nr:hypothetical protein [Nocardia bovistercoris]MBH0780847.1 hypothetical protein [Nocardia bovistercoris]